MDSWERFDETSLPDKEAFYSNLNVEDITDVDYRYAKRVFNGIAFNGIAFNGVAFKSLNNKSLSDYHDFYVQSDILLLADVFENFRNVCIEVYELDPAHFISAPGLAWQVCLKKIDVKLELITDPGMLLMVEKGISGGICHAIHRYAKVNNKYLKNYDENEESSFLEYLGANKLYGGAMSEPLTVGDFDWVEDLSKIDEDFIIHDLHSDLPFLPERMKIDKCNKLVCNLYNKKDYVVHIRSLKQALNNGLILKKVHRVIKFNQKAWLKVYIDMNTELRKQANNDFEKDFLKLMDNTLFCKTMENVSKHRDIKLVTTNKRRNQLVSGPNYHTTKWFSENLLAIEMKKAKVMHIKTEYFHKDIADDVEKRYLIHQIMMMNVIDHCLKERIKKSLVN